jgi:hypothetical protein
VDWASISAFSKTSASRSSSNAAVSWGEEWATWSSWRRSVGLVRHVAEKLVQAIGNNAELLITVAVFDDEEVFDSAATFARDVTADALRDFHRLTIAVPSSDEDAHIVANVILARDRRSAPKPRSASEVRLSVRSSDAEQFDHAQSVAHAACVALRRGHRWWLGRTAGSAGIPTEWRGFSIRWPPSAAKAGRALAGAAFTLLVLSTITTLFPKHPVSSILAALIAAAAGIGSIQLLKELVPSIEIAEPGKTRLTRTLRWGGVTTISLIASQVAKKAFGS